MADDERTAGEDERNEGGGDEHAEGGGDERNEGGEEHAEGGDEQAEGGGDERAQKEAREVEKAKEELHELEEGDPPEKLEDWPSGRAKYLTYGGPEGSSGYDEGATSKLGPSSLEHHEDGSVTIEGDPVDNPEDYKADEPIPGAPDRSGGDEDDEGGDENEGSGEAEEAERS